MPPEIHDADIFLLRWVIVIDIEGNRLTFCCNSEQGIGGIGIMVVGDAKTQLKPLKKMGLGVPTLLDKEGNPTWEAKKY